MKELALLGDEAVAIGALHAGVTAAYGYPGTPSTEILEWLIANYETGGPRAEWCANEKTSMEAALGVSFAGRRTLVTMKHVGLNVAADAFVNAALLEIKGGLVIAVADDPGMHSSQNEQDTRYLADFAMVPVFEPRTQQQAYEMTLEAYEISERFGVPVILRLSTRLSHARAGVRVGQQRSENPLAKSDQRTAWMLLPALARKRYEILIDKYAALTEFAANTAVNKLEMDGRDLSRVVITTGLGGNYYEENGAALAGAMTEAGRALPARLHIGMYPIPVESIRKLCEQAEKVLIIEEGMPFLEQKLRGILPTTLEVNGKLDGTLPRTGELNPDNVRSALGLPALQSAEVELALKELPGRPPQLCKGCPHGDSFDVIKKAMEGETSFVVTSDIGCYALGALPPYSVPETIVCMGASVNMAKGAADAGIKYAVAVLGDSTFLHSGMTALLDAIHSNTPVTIVILDNAVVAMTGCQETIIPSSQFRPLLEGLGVPAEHVVELEARRTHFDDNLKAIRAEMEYRGVSVVVFRRECLEAAKALKKKAGIVSSIKESGGQS
ncbi:MAG: indolepyruvate ferredoxin oxidoreductase [Spirochaetaceae bacterium]|nr:MAG: indolepyruvate ferredoxin oxidoreductase [Spirochaetaceae bacterium]